MKTQAQRSAKFGAGTAQTATGLTRERQSMLTKSQRDALVLAAKIIQDILEQDRTEYYTPQNKKYQRRPPDEVKRMRNNIIQDRKNGASVKNIAEKYQLTIPYVYAIARMHSTKSNEP